MLLGIGVRSALVIPAGFPLNDGGLFFAMTQELLLNDFRLPTHTTYNGEGIPYAYSPLAFYLVGGIARLSGIGLLDLLRWVPLVCAAGTVVVFAFLARELIADRWARVAAVTAFALIPRSYLWLVMGGGVTRAPGLLFAMLGLLALLYLFRTRQARWAVGAAALAALTAATHIGTLPFLIFSGTLFWALRGRHRAGTAGLAATVGGAVLFSAPWWWRVWTVHGLDPFEAAQATGGPIWGENAARYDVLREVTQFQLGTGEPVFPIIGTLALLGAVAMAGRRRALLPIWWGTTLVLDARAGATYATIAIAMLAGIAVTTVLVPLLARGEHALTAPHGGGAARPIPWPQRLLTGGVLAALLAMCGAGALAGGPKGAGEGRYLTALAPEDMRAITWVARETRPDADVLVLSGDAVGGWWADRVSEWLPVLASRRSVATVQGTEWLPERLFARRLAAYQDVQRCGLRDGDCLEAWVQGEGAAFDYLYLPRFAVDRCCAPLAAALENDDRFRLVYDGPGARVYARVPAVALARGGESARRRPGTVDARPAGLSSPGWTPRPPLPAAARKTTPSHSPPSGSRKPRRSRATAAASWSSTGTTDASSTAPSATSSTTSGTETPSS